MEAIVVHFSQNKLEEGRKKNILFSFIQHYCPEVPLQHSSSCNNSGPHQYLVWHIFSSSQQHWAVAAAQLKCVETCLIVRLRIRGKMGYTLLHQGRTASYSNTELQWRSPTVCQTLSRWETGIAPGPWGSWSRVRRHLWGDRRCCWGGRPPRSSCSGSTSPGRPRSHTGVWGREKKQFQLLQKRIKKNGFSCFSATLTAERDPQNKSATVLLWIWEPCTLLPHLFAAHAES